MNATAKLTAIIAGMAAGADSIDDLDMVRSGGMRKLFTGVYAAVTLGIFLREFTFGHTRQLSAVLRRHLVALAARTPMLAGIERAGVHRHRLAAAPGLRPRQTGRIVRAYEDRRQKHSAPWSVTPGGHDLHRDRSPGAGRSPARAGRAGSAKGAASMLTEAINTAIDAGAIATRILVRADSAYCAAKIVAAVVKAGARFSFAIARNPAVDAAIATIGDDAYIPVHYPGAVINPDTGQLISDAQVAEVPYTAFAGTRHQITARLIVRRVLDANTQDPLFPVWRHHPFFTNSGEPTAQADITHRRHAICETVWSDLIDGPWAHQPSGSFAANTAWCILAAICHNLLRAAGTLTAAPRYAVARGATLRSHLIAVPARLARPQHRPVLHLPAHWPRAAAWLTLWTAVHTT